jgi:nitrogen regulatory protein P-II 2
LAGQIDAFINPTRLSNVREELTRLGIRSFRIRPITSIGRSSGARPFNRSIELTDSETRDLELTLVVADEQLGRVIRALETHAADAEILVSSIEDACRVSKPAVTPLARKRQLTSPSLEGVCVTEYLHEAPS